MLFFELLAGASILSIILFIAGVGLVIVEMFEPGFGFFGILGVISLIICIFVTAQSVAEGIILTIFFFVILLILHISHTHI
jgi:membrane-bound ClpP family serine protease